MTSLAKKARHWLAVVLTVFTVVVVGFATLAAPASAAYAPTVKLTAYRIHRGQTDAALLTHFAPRHVGTVSTWQRHHRIVLKRFHTGRQGGAFFTFRIPFKLHRGFHVLLFKTIHKIVRVRIRVLR